VEVCAVVSEQQLFNLLVAAPAIVVEIPPKINGMNAIECPRFVQLGGPCCSSGSISCSSAFPCSWQYYDLCSSTFEHITSKAERK